MKWEGDTIQPVTRGNSPHTRSDSRTSPRPWAIAQSWETRSWSELGLRPLTWILALESRDPRELQGKGVVSLGWVQTFGEQVGVRSSESKARAWLGGSTGGVLESLQKGGL